MPRYINPVPGYTYPSYGKLYFYKSGTNTLLNTYADSLESIPNTNPLLLGALGRVPNAFYSGKARVVLHNADNEQIWERDPVGGEAEIGDFQLYDPIVLYAEYDIVKTSQGSIFRSLQSGNQDNTPSTSAYWEEVKFIDVWNTNRTYAAGDIVQTAEGYIWRSVTSANAANEPNANNGSNWLPAVNGDKIPFSPTLQTVTAVTTPHTVVSANTGSILVFSIAGSGTVNLPDALAIGSSVMVVNTGGGNVILANPGSDTLRGRTTLTDVAGYLAVTKIAATVWQSSER